MCYIITMGKDFDGSVLLNLNAGGDNIKLGNNKVIEHVAYPTSGTQNNFRQALNYIVEPHNG